MDRAESTEKNFLPHNRKDDAYDTKCMGTGSSKRFDAIRRMGGCKDEHLVNRIGTWREDWTGKRLKPWREDWTGKGMARGLSCGKVQGKAQSILELLEENGPVSEKTREMILSETDMERLSVWLKAAARSGSEEDFLDRIQ